MPTLPSYVLNTARDTQPRYKMHLSVCPRTTVFSATIDDHTINLGGTVIAIKYSAGSGTPANVKSGMTVDFGSTVGGREYGSVRVRSIDNGAGMLYIAETPWADIPYNFSDYLTIRDEYLLWQKKPRIEMSKEGGANYFNNFTEYHDWGIKYTDENEFLEPKANITQNDKKTQAKCAGYINSGDSLFYVSLDGTTSTTIDPNESITGYLWDLGDGSTDDDLTDSDIVAKFPVGFRWISLTVTSSNGKTNTVRLPIWAHDPDNDDSLSGFVVEQDQRSEGREMTLRFNNPDDDLADTVIPRQSTVCFWQEVSHTQYISQFLGWTKEERTKLQLYNSDVTLGIGGAPYWLREHIDGFAQKITTIDDSPEKWYQMIDTTIDKVIHYLLREYTTFLDICNFYPSGINNKTPGETLPGGRIWKQIVDQIKSNEKCTVSCDSMNAMYLYQPYQYKSAADQATISSTADLDPGDLHYDTPITIAERYGKKCGYVVGNGDVYVDGSLTFYKSEAPAWNEGYAGNEQTTEYQRLPELSPQIALNRIVGVDYSRANNPYSDVQIKLLGDWDYFEIGWGEYITLTYQHPNVRGINWNQQKFIIKRIDVAYSSEDNQPPKVVTLTCEMVIPYIQGFGSELYKDPGVTPNDYKACISSDGKLLATANYTSSSPTWVETNLSLFGKVVQVKQLDFPLSAGDDALVVTTTNIYTVEDVFGTPSAISRHAFRATSEARSMNSSRGATRAAVCTNYDDGTYIIHSEDYTTWSTETQYGNGAICGSGGLETTLLHKNDFQTSTDLLLAFGTHDVSGGYGGPPNGQIASEHSRSDEKIDVRWDFPAEVSAVDEVRFWYKTSSGTPTISVRIVLYDQNQVKVRYDSDIFNVEYTTAWQQLSHTFTAVNDVGIIRIIITDSSSSDTHYIDDLELWSSSGLTSIYINTISSCPLGSEWNLSCGGNTVCSKIGGYRSSKCIEDTSDPTAFCAELSISRASTFIGRVQFYKQYYGSGTVTEEVIYEDASHIEIDRETRTVIAHTDYQLAQFDKVLTGVYYIKIKLTGTIGVEKARIDEIQVFAGNHTLPATDCMPPGCFVSDLNIGKIYTSGLISSVTDGFESDDNGATVTQISAEPVIDPDEDLAAEIAPVRAGNFNDETILYYRKTTGTDALLYKVEFTGTTEINISPSYQSETYGPYKSLGTIEHHYLDGNITIFCLGNYDRSKVGIWTTINGGQTLDLKIPPSELALRVERCFFYPNNGTLQADLCGGKGFIGFTPDLCDTLFDKRGNISGVGEIIGVINKRA